MNTIYHDKTNSPLVLRELQALKNRTNEFLEIVKSPRSSRREKVESHAVLGGLYLNEKKYDKALFHLQKALELNRDKGFNKAVSAANYGLGMIYIHGKGRKINNIKAFTYFSHAALTWDNWPAMEEVYVMCIKKEASINDFHEFERTLYKSLFLSNNPKKKEIATNGISLMYKCSSETEFIKKNFTGGK